MLPREAVLEYQDIYKSLHGSEISYEQAEEQGSELIQLFQAVYRPIPKSWVNQRSKGGEKNGDKHNC